MLDLNERRRRGLDISKLVAFATVRLWLDRRVVSRTARMRRGRPTLIP